MVRPSPADGEEVGREGLRHPQQAAEFPGAAPPEALSELQLGQTYFSPLPSFS